MLSSFFPPYLPITATLNDLLLILLIVLKTAQIQFNYGTAN